MWKMSNLMLNLLACMIFHGVTFRWELEIYIHMSTWLQLQNLFSYFFVGLWMDFFLIFLPPLSFVMQWTTVDSILASLLSLLWYFAFLFSVAGERKLHSLQPDGKEKNFYSGLLLKLTVREIQLVYLFELI